MESQKLKETLITLQELGDTTIAEHSKGFFKTAPGEYGEGDQFLGIRVPVIRNLAKKLKSFSHDETIELLHSPWHEARLLALIILVNRYKKTKSEAEKEEIFDAYINERAYINNWDLIDVTVEHIVGAHLYGKDPQILYAYAKTGMLWERRIAMMANFYAIRRGRFCTALDIAEILVNDRHDLIQKAVGWMLREIGKRDQNTEIQFLEKYSTRMPRTMLRYAIERFDEPLRQSYLKRRDS